MITVPRYDSPGVQEQGLPEVRNQGSSSLESFGGGPSLEKLDQAGQTANLTAMKIATDEKNAADDLRTKAAYVDFSERINKVNDEWQQIKGGDAVNQDLVGDYGKKFQDEADAVKKDLSPDQQSIFSNMEYKERVKFDNDLHRHVGTQREIYEQEVTKTGVATEIDKAGRSFLSPDKIQDSLRNQEAFLSSQRGKSQATIDMEIENAKSKTYKLVIERMLATGLDQKAKAYYDENKNFVTGADGADLDKMLEEGTLRGEGQRKSNEILNKYPGSMSQALKAARDQNQDDPKLQDEVVQRVKSRFAEIEASDRIRDEALDKKHANILEKERKIEAIPPAEWAGLTEAQRENRKTFLANLDKGTPKLSDDYFKLRRQALDNEDAFVKVNLQSYRGKIDNTELEGLLDIQSAKREKSDKKDPLLDDWRTEDSIVSGTLESLGVNPNPKPGDKAGADEVRQFRSAVAREVRKLQENTKKKASKEDYEKIVKQQAVEGVTQRGWFWNTRKKLYQLNDGESFDSVEIPSSERDAITKEIEKRGKTATEDEITKWYLRGLSQ